MLPSIGLSLKSPGVLLDGQIHQAMTAVTDTKQRLLNTALKLVWEQSYGSVSVDQICEKADVRKGSFYHFFASKADLAIAAAEEHWNKLRTCTYSITPKS